MTTGATNFQELKPRIIVMGVGGAGGNAVNNMIASGLQGVEFVAANTDAQALSMSGADVRFQLGANLTEGLGAGSNPEIGEGAAEEVMEEMRELMQGAHMVFVACGMGGGTGTGAAPVVARVAQDMGVLTVAVVTKPFHFEGRRRMRIAEAGIEQLRKYVDTMIVIPNQNLFRLANEQTTFADSFQLADQVLNSGVACVTDLIMKEGLINLDFADVKTVITEMGAAVMGTGLAHGENRAEKAAEEAISNPLIDDISLAGAKGLLISISGGPDMTLFEVDEVASRIRREVDPDANIIVGAIFDDHLQGHLRVSLVASGLNHAHPKSMHEEADRLRMEQDSKLENDALQPKNEGLNDRLQQLEQGAVVTGALAHSLPRGRGGAPVQQGQLQQGQVQKGHVQHGQVGQVEGAPRGQGVTGSGQDKGKVQIKNKPPRFMSEGVDGIVRDAGAAGHHAADGMQGEGGRPDDVASGRDFVPGAPRAAQRPMRRMPRIDELPPTAQNQMRAYEAPRENHGLVAQKKKVGFFDRITGRGGRPDQGQGPLKDTAGDGVPQGGEQEAYQQQTGHHTGHNTGQGGFRDAYGQRPPAPTPVPAQIPQKQDFEERGAETDHDVAPAKAQAGEAWQAERPETASERYPTVEIQKSPLPDMDYGEGEEPLSDIPPFLRKTNK